MKVTGLTSPFGRRPGFFAGTAVVVTLKKAPVNVWKEAGETGVKTRVKTRVKARGKILDAIRQNPQITVPELCVVVDLTQKGIEWNIKKLKAEGLIRRVGPAKGGHWEVLSKRSPLKNQ